MRRITVSLPDDVADILADESRRLHCSVSEIVRDAVERKLDLSAGAGRRPLPFANLGASGHRDTSTNVDAILAAEWPGAYDRDR